MLPSANAWLTATRPCSPAAMVRSAMSRSSDSAGLASVVQMNVDSLAEPLGEAEHDVELTLDVAVEAGRVQPADQIGAGVERRGDEIGRALLGRHAALREGDELNVDPVAVGLAHPQHGLEIVKADVVVDVDVAAHARRAIGDQRANECGGACFDRQRDAMALDALSGDAFAHAPSLDMGQARRAPMRLVEMDVAVDERRQEQRARKIDAFAWRDAALPGALQRRDEAVRDFHVGEIALRKARVGQDHQARFRRFAAA